MKLCWIGSATTPPEVLKAASASMDSEQWVSEPSSADGIIVAEDRLGELVRLREAYGPSCRLIGLIHADSCIDATIVSAAHALAVMDQLPRLLSPKVKPVMAVVRLPWQVSIVDLPEFHRFLDEAAPFLREQADMPLILSNAVLLNPGVLSGPGVCAVTVVDGDDTYARNSADDLANYLWERRSQVVQSRENKHSSIYYPQEVDASWEMGLNDWVWFGYQS